MKLRTKFDLEKGVSYGVLAATILMMLWVVRSVFSTRGYLYNWDAEFYSLSGQYWVRNLLPHGNLAGWFPLWLGGFDYYVMYPPMTAYLLGLSSLVLGPVLPTRIFSVAIWIAFVPVMYNFLRSLGNSRLISSIGASLMVTLDALLSAGYSAIFMIGFLPQGLGFVWSIGLLGRMFRAMRSDRFDSKRSLITGALIGGLTLSHHFCTLWFGITSTIMLGVFSAGSIFWREKVKSYVVSFAVGLALSAFWWVPLLMNRKMMVEVPPVFSPLSTAEQWANIYRHFSPFLHLLILLGAGYLCLTRQWRVLAFVLLMGGFSLLQSFGIIPFPFEIISPVQARRFQAYSEWSALVMMAFAFRGIQDVYEKNLFSKKWVLLPNVLLLLVLHFQLRSQTFQRFLDNPPIFSSGATDKLPELAAVLKDRLKPGEIHMSEASDFAEDGARYTSPHFLHENLVRMVPGLWDLAGGYPESVWGAKAPFWLTRLMGQKIGNNEAYIRRQGVRYVSTMLSHTGRTASQLPWLQKIWEAADTDPKLDHLILFEVRNFDTPFGLTPELGKEMNKFIYTPPGNYALTFTRPVALPQGTAFAVNYHPWMRLFVDGRRVASTYSQDKKMAIGETIDHAMNVEIRYVWPLTVSITRFFSISCWIFIGFFLIRGRRYPWEAVAA